MTSASYNTFKIIDTFQQFHSTLHQYSSSSTEQVQEILERQESALIPIGIKLSENLISKRKSRAKEFELASQDENRFTMEYLLENLARREAARLESAEKRKLFRTQNSETPRVLGGYSSNRIKNAIRQGFMNVEPEQRQ